MPQTKPTLPQEIMATDYSVPGKCPLEFSQNIADAICERIAEGQSLREICRDANMPGRASIYRWLMRIQPFAEQYMQARELQAETFFDEILDIADDATNDWMARRGGEAGNGWSENGEALRRSALRIETRKWMLSRLRPKKYGKQERMTLSGPHGEDGEQAAIQINIVDAQH